MRLALAAAVLALPALPAMAQAPAAADDEKISQVIVYGDDPCPRGNVDEIVVCARKPESERYRIPKNLRGNPHDRSNESWTNRATELQYAGRSGIGSCSPVG